MTGCGSSPAASLEKPVTVYVREAFALLTTRCQVELAQILFNRANPGGLTQLGQRSLIRTLRDWQLWLPTAQARLADPFSLLPPVGTLSDGSWQLPNAPGHYRRLDFRPEPVAVPLVNALLPGAGGRLRTLMSEVVTRCRYGVLGGYDFFGELLFRRPGDVRLYWLRLRRVVGGSNRHRRPGCAPTRA